MAWGRSGRAAALNLVGLRPKHTVYRDALLDEIRLHSKLVGKIRGELAHVFGLGRPSDLVLNGGAKS